MKLKHILKSFIILSSFVLLKQVHADCSIYNGSSDLGNYSSIEMDERGVDRASTISGLRCKTGINLSVRTFIKFEVNDIPDTLVSKDTTDSLKIYFEDINGYRLFVGAGREYKEYNLLSLFSKTNNDFIFLATIPAGQTVAPGRYNLSTPAKLRWYYAVPNGGIGCRFVNYDKSPGVELDYWHCVIKNWGSGYPSAVNYSLTILPDCRIATEDVNFGTSAFANAFEPVKTTLGVRCAVKTPYTVGLSNGQNGERRLRSGNNYLNYELYKSPAKLRWGANGAERWSSTEATTNPGVHDGKTQQTYILESEILKSNNPNLPAGTYTDKVTVDVKF
ncbi:spore coat protein U-like protein [Acinetobacter calcoaceticus]|uniref:Spore coat protein U-like protein n=1 Tax=Acinetobacter calcoaceticus TaxID=471 RepID=A0A4R1XVR2_ACICA|nr:spore coat protein U-like protein [Acinetobacter calcoaceticus]